MRQLWLPVSLSAALLLSARAQAVAAAIEYREVAGCPNRATFEQELLQRVHTRQKSSEPTIVVMLVRDGARFGGQVLLRDGEALLSRQVFHENCGQLVRALALIAALMMEGEPQHTQSAESHSTPGEADAGTSPPAASAFSQGAQTARPFGTTASPPTSPTSPAPALSVLPWFAITTERVITTEFWFGLRVGASVALRRLLPGSEQTVRLSAAQIKSRTLGDAEREASVAWTSLRMDACHGLSFSGHTSFGLCSGLDVGRLSGQGTVDRTTREKQGTWSRVGASLYLRQGLLGPLVFEGDLGLVAPLTYPEFYFGETQEASELKLTRVRRIGPVAHFGLGIEFQ